jgi:Uma2 family endonuclease
MQIQAIPAGLEFPDIDKPYVEEIRGRREPKVSPRRRHALLHVRISSTLDRWAGDRGEVGTEWRCYLIAGESHPSSLVPDVAYYSFARLPVDLSDDERERPRIAPDIAVEILSPEDRRTTLEEKIELYLRHGSVVVLVFDPLRRTLAVHDKDGSNVFPAIGRIAIDRCADLVLDCDDLYRGL